MVGSKDNSTGTEYRTGRFSISYRSTLWVPGTKRDIRKQVVELEGMRELSQSKLFASNKSAMVFRLHISYRSRFVFNWFIRFKFIHAMWLLSMSLVIMYIFDCVW